MAKLEGAGMSARLARYHARPGRTAEMFANWQDLRGRSSYARIVDRVAVEPQTSRILDLACGDGYLLELLLDAGLSNVIGVDRSAGELGMARRRLGERAELRQEDACSLSIAAGSIDVVVCHMALMMFDPVELALQEIARVLRADGLFLAVNVRPFSDRVFTIFRSEVKRATLACGLGPVQKGDPRTLTAGGLSELVGRHLAPCSVKSEEFDVSIQTSPASLWSVLRLMYDVERLSDDTRATLGQRTLEAWAPLVDDDGTVTCSFGMRSLEARANSIY